MDAEAEHPVVLFDGVCNLCENSVQFIIRRDKHARFRFASLQSVAAQQLMSEHRYSDDELSSVLLIANGKLYRKSRAGLQIAKRLDGAWPLLYYIGACIPLFISDPVYDYIGNRRYRWFGKKAECWVPDDDLRQRFVKEPLESGRNAP